MLAINPNLEVTHDGRVRTEKSGVQWYDTVKVENNWTADDKRYLQVKKVVCNPTSEEYEDVRRRTRTHVGKIR